jgi:exodeoxyribonuclease III
MVRLLSWNILQGGGTRSRGIAEYIRGAKPDIVTLQEFRNNDEILAALKSIGLKFIHVPDTNSASEHTILIASRFGFDAGDFMPEEIRPVPILEASFPDDALGFPFTLLCVHFPQKEPQVPLFKQLIADSASLTNGDALLIGDMNCGIPFADSMTKTFFATEYFQTLLKSGWTDAWRTRHPDATEYTWISSVKKHGFRYDQALASQSFDKRIARCVYDHNVRENGLSDHSAMIVEW